MFDREKKFERGTPQSANGNSGAVATGEQGYADGAAPPPPPPPQGDERTAVLGEQRTRDERSAGRTGAAGDAVVLDREARLRQRDEFGGFNWGAAFFGWIVAIGIGVLLTAIVSAAGAAIGLTDASVKDAQNNADTIGIVGGALLILIAVIAYYAGGYVAGRMSRFDGARQGFGVWLFGLILTLVVAAAGAILGDQYNVFEQLKLPRIPVSTSDLTTGGIIALAAIALGSLVAAIAGGKVGERYHRRVDRAAIAD
jgi:amino acid transporter